ncbi:MAG: transporter [Naasia sp.]|nr:transporter [Naasia sp.]
MTSASPSPVAAPADAPAAPMTHRAVLTAMSGLLLGMFVSILAATVVGTSLPVIVSDLGGDQNAYTWVITSTLLATTVSTPIWGKLADLFSRKLLVQLSLVIFVVGSALAGLSEDTGTLILWRVLQGLGAGGLTALVTVVIADLVSPRERGRYAGLMGAVMAVGTVGGPLLGGFITDAWGWRWNFYVPVPVAVAALIVLQLTLHLPVHKRKVKIDFLGAILVSGAVSLLLIWISLAGNSFQWNSWQTWVMVSGAVVLTALFIFTEFKVSEPIIPLSLFRNRTFTLSVVASISVGVAMFGSSVFLGQYMQLARGKTPTESGLLTLPMVVGLLLSSIIIGQVISRTGKWKRYMVTGSVLLIVGIALMSTIRYDTDFVLVAIYMFVMGAGVGMVMQNLVLVVQNTVRATQLGVASAGVAFFRSLGGTIGVTVMGAVLGSRVTALVTDGFADAGIPATAVGGDGSIPHVSELPGPIRVIVESAYGQGVGEVFLVALPLAVITLIAIAFLPNLSLGTKTAAEQRSDELAADEALRVGAAEMGSTALQDGALGEPRSAAGATAEPTEAVASDGTREPARRG